MKCNAFTNSFRPIYRAMSKKLLFILVIALGFGQAKAQVFLSVGANGKIFSFEDTICFSPSNSVSDFYYIYVKNTGSSTFNGTIDLNLAVDSSMTGFFSWTAQNSFSNTMLNPGDSTVLSYTEDYDTGSVAPTGPVYRMGGNIVVIWPSATGAITVDSSEHDTVYILTCNGVNEISDDHGLSVFPNPTTDNVSLRIKGNASISSIGLFNIQGELLKNYKATNSLSFTEFPAGMYFLRVEFADKSTHTYKIIRKE